MPNGIKGYYPDWSPRKKTQALLEQTKELFERYAEQLPLTLRQVFYLLVANYGYEKTEAAYGRLSNALIMARRAKLVPFDYLRDDSFSGYSSAHYESQDEFWAEVRRKGRRFTLDKLANQDVSIRVHSEAAGMLMQLRRICEPYSVPVYSCSGFDSLTVKHDLKEDARRDRLYTGRITVVLHLGDLDPSGLSIFDSMAEDVTAFLEEDLENSTWSAGDVIRFERVALTRPQAERLGVPSAPPKKTDSRTAKWGDEPTYQLEAAPPDVLAGYLTSAIESWLDMDQYEEDCAADGYERDDIDRCMRALPAGD